MAQDPVKYNPKEELQSGLKENSLNNGCAEKEPYALQVLGAEMEPDFPDQCIIVIEPYSRALPDAYVVAEVEGEKWFRQYKETPDGSPYLAASNNIYPDIDLTHLDWKIIGIIRQRNIRRNIKHFEYTGE